MSLYYEAAAVLANPNAIGGSLKSRIYKQKDLKSTPGQIFALIAETSKWSLVLKDVIDKCGMLVEEKKLTPVLALLLTHDLLLTKNGVAAPATHVLKLAVTRHKARLSAELTKARLRYGYATLDAFRQAVGNGELNQQREDAPKRRHPRWLRVNTVKTTLWQQLSTTFAGFERTESLSDVLYDSSKSRIYFEDPNIPNLLAIPSHVDLSKVLAYTDGDIIFQDKASCFPAYLLNPQPSDGDIIDGTAAPGNKTTHLAAILSSRNTKAQNHKVIAFERDKVRTPTLQKMVNLASADGIVCVRGNSDFLATRPNSDEFARVGAILLDPSCSGTGIVGRDNTLQMHLPNAQISPQTFEKGKKRKRSEDAHHLENPDTIVRVEMGDSISEETPAHGKLSERLTALSSFQLHILTHAMQFPNARKITYSTCSIHFEENEAVVFQALSSPIAKERGWKILKKQDQVEGLQSWHLRGVWEENKVNCGIDELQKSEILEACIRCNKDTEDGTMGFFVAAFVRKHPEGSQSVERIDEEGAEEWNGFSDTEEPDANNGLTSEKSKRRRKKKRKAKNQ